MKQRALSFALNAAPIALSVVITSILVAIVGADPLVVFQKIGEGAFRNTEAFAQVVNFWIPLTLCSIGLIVTFTAGLWNIGVEGQMIMGAVFASWGALTLQLPPLLLVPVEILLAMLGGALWALVVGFLKTRLGVHEIFGGVALNALATQVSLYLISGPWQPPEGGSVRSTPPFPTDALLPPISEAFSVSLLALILVFAAIIGVWLALRGTRWGLQLKATGKNARSALLLGVPTGRSSLSAFMVCGAMAGIAGAYRVLFTYGSLRQGVSGGIGFLALLVVLLVASRPLITPIVAFIFTGILVGSSRLKISTGLDASLASVLQDTVVLVALLFAGLRGQWEARRAANNVEVVPAIPAEKAPTKISG